MIDVVVALGLLTITFGMMFVITLTGVRPDQHSSVKFGVCAICEETAAAQTIGHCPVCDACATEYF